MQQTIKAVEKTNEAMSETMNSLLIRDEKLDDMLRKTTEMSDISSSIARKVVVFSVSLAKSREMPF